MSYPQDPTNVESKHQKIQSMAIVGHTTHDSCKLWVRLYRPGVWWLVVSELPLSGDLDSLDGKEVDNFLLEQPSPVTFYKRTCITKLSDNTHVFEIDSLSADKRYYYAVIADLQHANDIPRRTEVGHHEKKFFRTLPLSPDKIVFGFHSCHDPFSTASYSEGAWPAYYDSLIDRDAMFSIAGGDQVYVDTNNKEDMYSIWQWLASYKNKIIKAYRNTEGELKEEELVLYFTGIYRNYYRIYWNFINLKKVCERFPQYMIWDDHEIMDGWGSYSSHERKKLLNKLFQDDDEETNGHLIQLMFRAAKHVYHEYQHQHNPDTVIDLHPDKNPICEWDYHFNVGEFAFYVLDMRGHHDYERYESGNALLGDQQMKRLKAWLDTDQVKQAKAVFIASPVPVVHWGPFVSSLDVGSLKDDLRDEWEHETNWQERKKLLNSVFEFSNESQCSVTFLSGDVHCSSIYEFEHENFPNAKVFNATSSAISRKPAPEKAEYFMKKSGVISGYNEMRVNRLYAMSGEYNFFIITASHDGENTSVNINLCWPGGTDREVIQKKVELT